MGEASHVDDMGYAYFQRKALEFARIDLRQYRSAQMQRRLSSLMRRAKANDFVDYARILERDPASLQAFQDFFTINVSEFFRDGQRFRELEDIILPRLLKNRRQLRVWSAGCSYGAEPYSVAVILEEKHCLDYRILATDIDRKILDRARLGQDYTPSELKNVDERLLAKYFARTGERYAVVSRIRQKIEFRPHDLLQDPFDGDFDLILCRNVVIYFTEEAKALIYHKFYRSLRPGGVLFVGGTEVIMKAGEMGFRSDPCSFYWKGVAA